MKFMKYPLVGALVLGLSGCGYLFGDKGVFRDTSEDYKKAPEVPPIHVPEGKDSDALQEIYAIPPVQDEMIMAGEFEVPRPAPLVAGADEELVRIQRLGDESWALIAAAPGQVWPQVRAFYSAAGISVARVDARAGVMETTWLELESQPMASRFRVRIEQGVQRGSSELHVLQMNQAGDIHSWPANSDNVEQESGMLKALAQYIANSTGTAPVSMVAEQAISASGRISIAEAPEGYAYIRLDLPFDRAWASLGKALQLSTFEITDRDRSTGEYFTVFLGPQSEEEDGWFDWLWGDEEEHPYAGQSFTATAEPVDEDSVKIRLHPQDPELEYGRREEQALLVLIKGNIN
jgi:outer membrane protein assembly factor BamC